MSTKTAVEWANKVRADLVKNNIDLHKFSLILQVFHISVMSFFVVLALITQNCNLLILLLTGTVLVFASQFWFGGCILSLLEKKTGRMKENFIDFTLNSFIDLVNYLFGVHISKTLEVHLLLTWMGMAVYLCIVIVKLFYCQWIYK